MPEPTDAVQPDTAPLPVDTDQDRTAGTGLDALVGLTQAQLNAIIANEKKQAKLSVLKELGDVDALKAKAAKFDELEAANLSENQKLQKTIDDMAAAQVVQQQQIDAARLDALRLRIGQELGLPPTFSARLQGADEDALKADAQVVLAAMKIDPSARVPNIDATAGGGQQGAGTPTPNLTPEQIAAAIKAEVPLDKYAEALAQTTGE